ncbi:hypothetical protein Pint_31560 [Pistacia integerrima]|uniref:Uncharacterized protein n=1 Tax=Pistacia integerrima TaxID=434235 RepID=A0ACC0XSH6_9ROSI|nr:hypothetical protein Pint_31560 [Pistacia integerrima]
MWPATSPSSSFSSSLPPLFVFFASSSLSSSFFGSLVLPPDLVSRPSNGGNLEVAKEGIPLPPDRTICPLCSQKRANPSVVTGSGFVFCYACIFKYISQYKRCPVTLMASNVEQIRRLFHDV